MAQYGSSTQTAQITTGNVRTTLDIYTTNPTIYVPNGQRNPLGEAYYDNPSSLTVPGGTPTKYRYVRYNSTANAAVIAVPGPVFWVDSGKTTVTSTMSEGLTATQQDIAGWLMPNSTDYSGLTATILNGNFCFIAVAGFVTAGASAVSIVKGDFLIGGASAWVPVRVASGTAPGYKLGAIALTDVSSSASNLSIQCESL